jgi:hypothetical protein
MTTKKAKGKGKAAAKKAEKKSAEKSAPKTKGKDIVQVRENINELVKGSAELIATEVIKVAMTGQLATAKYLFEAVGLYPPTEETSVRPIETTLAHTLLKRMGLPIEPVITDEDQIPAAKSLSDEAGSPVGAQEDPEDEEAKEDVPVAAEGEK